MRPRTIVFVVLILAFLRTVAFAQQPAPAGALSKMPVKEITVFKDGHCLMLHRGAMPTNADGDVVLDSLPTPVLGTFWPYSADKDAKLSATISGRRLVSIDRTALSLHELIEANVGADVVVTEAPIAPQPPAEHAANSQTIQYNATIVSIPKQTIAEQERTSPPAAQPDSDRQADFVLLKLESGGTKVVHLDRIIDITFRGDHHPTVAHDEYRNVLTLKLASPQGGPHKDSADVGMLYLQKGIRWIPNYKITIDGKGSAHVQLQATLLNEMTDLTDVTANLVIGVPNFDFKDTIDPIALQQTVAQLSSYFQANAQTGYAFSNGIMTQAGARAGEFQRRGDETQPPPPADLGPEIGGSQKNEDLFVFTVQHVTLKKGQRMVVPVTDFTLAYTDVYSLDIPFAPPPDMRQQFNSEQQAQIVKLFNAPRVMHKIRMNNNSKYPITTAPALIVRADVTNADSQGRVIGQGMTSYTAIGANCDLTLTAAVDIKVKKVDAEARRVPNAAEWDGNRYIRIELDGTIDLTNYSAKPTDIEVVRNVLGNVSNADSNGKVESVNVFEDTDYTPVGSGDGSQPYWWGWYSWPYWWHHFNGVGRITWNVHLDANQSTQLKYSWSYYWR
jgi:hypothetical protein